MARTSATEAETLSMRAAQALERDILSGALAPGARLAVADLAQHYQIGATPIREGLSRLVSRGLINAIGQRGFRVAAVSREDLIDITETRVTIESEALRRSMARGGVEWEANLIAAFHKLQRVAETAGRRAVLQGEDYEMLHKAFHTALIGGSGSPRMLALQSDLYDQASRYRVLMMKKLRRANDVIEDHHRLMTLALSRDPKAVEYLIAHVHSTLHIVYPDSKPK